ncbi:hypothetical protein PVK06_045682 [Gossypium arboreum]|uniref:Uncharacterized protein n=1 Tax=Gossypium arboreum TaxID=29729 RepID=A0ABR0MUR7_GOSAR|nr:hypothetical protein PVK06_045682 [Gossypium arboreum]
MYTAGDCNLVEVRQLLLLTAGVPNQLKQTEMRCRFRREEPEGEQQFGLQFQASSGSPTSKPGRQLGVFNQSKGSTFD